MSSTWLKENLFVAAALTLPLVVVGLFLVATTIPRLLVDGPRHDLLFALGDYSAQRGDFAVRFRVEDGSVFADASVSPQYGGVSNQQLYRFDAATLDVRRIDVEIPSSVRQDLAESVAHRQQSGSPAIPPLPPGPLLYPVSFRVTETAGITLLEGSVAPDGYEFDSRYDGNGGLFGELFGMGSSRDKLRISKDSRVIALPLPDRNARHYYYADATLLGWVGR